MRSTPQPSRAVGRTVAIGAAALLVLLLTACGSDGDDAASTESPTARPTPARSVSASPTPNEEDDGGESFERDAAAVWAEDAQQHRGQDGKTFKLKCPPMGEESPVWGAGVYTDDSSICTAAVQSGLISLRRGGTVTYEIAPGERAYDAGTANGITSQSYGAWDGSFTFPDAPPGSVEFAAGPESWSQNATAYQGEIGKRVTVSCAANGTLGSVWGTGTYTDDSSVCTAAVHAGLITVAAGGTVVIQIAPGQASYAGTTANGVTSGEYAAYEGSFLFPPDQPPGG